MYIRAYLHHIGDMYSRQLNGDFTGSVTRGSQTEAKKQFAVSL